MAEKHTILQENFPPYYNEKTKIWEAYANPILITNDFDEIIRLCLPSNASETFFLYGEVSGIIYCGLIHRNAEGVPIFEEPPVNNKSLCVPVKALPHILKFQKNEGSWCVGVLKHTDRSPAQESAEAFINFLLTLKNSNKPIRNM